MQTVELAEAKSRLGELVARQRLVRSERMKTVFVDISGFYACLDGSDGRARTWPCPEADGCQTSLELN